MNVIHKDVESAVEKEMTAAIKKHGLNHSFHEKYAVMLEEAEEAYEEVEEVKAALHRMWVAIRLNDDRVAAQNAARLEHFAINAAEEFIQLAAMARKAVEK